MTSDHGTYIDDSFWFKSIGYVWAYTDLCILIRAPVELQILQTIVVFKTGKKKKKIENHFVFKV